MSNGKRFVADVRAWAERFPDQLDALARQTSQQVSMNVVSDTPLDTGFLRGSWQPALGQPSTGEPDGASGGDARSKAAITLTVAQMKAGDIYTMVNNAKYAKRLEWGFVGQDSLGRSYNQQGRFFVTDNVKRWPQVVAEVAADLGLTK